MIRIKIDNIIVKFKHEKNMKFTVKHGDIYHKGKKFSEIKMNNILNIKEMIVKKNIYFEKIKNNLLIYTNNRIIHGNKYMFVHSFNYMLVSNKIDRMEEKFFRMYLGLFKTKFLLSLTNEEANKMFKEFSVETIAMILKYGDFNNSCSPAINLLNRSNEFIELIKHYNYVYTPWSPWDHSFVLNDVKLRGYL